MIRRRLAITLLAALAASSAHAGLFDDDEARLRIQDLKASYGARMDKLETSARAQLDLANQVESLKAEVARLRGQVELLTNDADNATRRQKDFYVDLDNRLRKLEAKATEVQAAAEAAKPDPAAEGRDFEAALTLLRAGKFKEAETGFTDFLKAYPQSSYRASAHFWTGTAASQIKDLSLAEEHFGKFASQWPDDARAPDALLGQANAIQAQGNIKEARAVLEKLVQEYPNSPAAASAKQRLKK
ncbi:MAG: tol-pal system protein YbgF [Zoogloea sp.]|nr:tol-pal system protein YbgF [Zoogloea sp.]